MNFEEMDGLIRDRLNGDGAEEVFAAESVHQLTEQGESVVVDRVGAVGFLDRGGAQLFDPDVCRNLVGFICHRRDHKVHVDFAIGSNATETEVANAAEAARRKPADFARV
ncbi:MAG TPA: hypothetical protein VNC50_17530 [Planctomycetia bacterium]|nr:hypothetical protein [Planctomycetia bacterium]